LSRYLGAIAGFLAAIALAAAEAPRPSSKNAAATGSQLHDITGIEEVPPAPPRPRWPYWLAGTLALCGAGVLIGVGLGRRARRQPTVDPLSAALAELERLQAKVETGYAEHECQTVVAGIVRTFLSSTLHVAESGRTSEEFLAAVQESALLTSEQNAELAEVLTHADLAKFARAGAETADWLGVISAARTVVQGVGASTRTAIPAPSEDGRVR
jgi:hypothetical protein